MNFTPKFSQASIVLRKILIANLDSFGFWNVKAYPLIDHGIWLGLRYYNSP